MIRGEPRRCCPAGLRLLWARQPLQTLRAGCKSCRTDRISVRRRSAGHEVYRLAYFDGLAGSGFMVSGFSVSGFGVSGVSDFTLHTGSPSVSASKALFLSAQYFTISVLAASTATFSFSYCGAMLLRSLAARQNLRASASGIVGAAFTALLVSADLGLSWASRASESRRKARGFIELIL